MKYGKYEFERTFLLEKDCLEGKKIDSIKQIKDKYIDGTNLRLRKVIENNHTTYKLTQKEKLNPVKPGVLKINTLYLSKVEFDKINVLKGIEIKKERHLLIFDHIRIGIDRILLKGKSIFIAEVEFETEQEMNTFKMPLPNIMEITEELRYSGYEIAKEYSRAEIES